MCKEDYVTYLCAIDRPTVVFGPKLSIPDKFRELLHTVGPSFDIVWCNGESIPDGREVV